MTRRRVSRPFGLHQENIIKTYKKYLISFFALLSLLALMPQASQAQTQPQGQRYAGPPRIDGFNVDEVRRLTPGAELNFSLYGTPGGNATLRIAGAQRNLTLYEAEAGQYEGSYTISSRDKITAKSAVTANLRSGNQVASMVLSESLQAGVGYHPAKQAAGAPQITRFDVQPSAELGGGNDLAFTLYGTPGGKAEIAIAGAPGKFFLQEIKAGEYSGVYTVRRRDRIASNSVVTANLRVNDRIASATLGKPLQLAAAPARPVARMCANCGVVEAVNLVEVKGDGGYLGTIGGGVVGGLLGNQVGGGNGKTAATVVGAIGGALAGRAIEGNVRKTVHHEVVVRLETGAAQMVSFETDPGYRIGDKVRITDGALTRNQ
jgi:outer membrane lipoprotein SlyB